MNPTLIRFTLIRHKVIGLILGGIIALLVGSGCLYFFTQLSFGGGRFLVILLGFIFLGMAVFSFFAYYKLWQEHFTAMYISDEGINDISTGNTIGTVLWRDVESVKVMKELGCGPSKRKYIVLKVSNPKEYIQREPNRIKRRTLELKFQYYSSPICFSDRALNCTFDELKEAVFFKYNYYKEHMT